MSAPSRTLIQERYDEDTTRPAEDFHTPSRSLLPPAFYITPSTSYGGLYQGMSSNQHYAYPPQASQAAPTPYNIDQTSTADFSNINDTNVVDFAHQTLEGSPTPAPRPKQAQVKKFPCTWEGCFRMFTCPHNVEQHIREKHTGERPHKCDECPASFPRPYSLNRHVLSVHGRRIGPGRGKGQSTKTDRRAKKIEERKTKQQNAGPLQEQPSLPSQCSFSGSPADVAARDSEASAFDEQQYPVQDGIYASGDGFDPALYDFGTDEFGTNDFDQNSFDPNAFDSNAFDINHFHASMEDTNMHDIVNPVDTYLPPALTAQLPPAYTGQFPVEVNQQQPPPQPYASSQPMDQTNANKHPSISSNNNDIELPAISDLTINEEPSQQGPVACIMCVEVFGDDQDVLDHLHTVHGFERGAHCHCSGCKLLVEMQRMDAARIEEGMAGQMSAEGVDGEAEPDWEAMMEDGI